MQTTDTQEQPATAPDDIEVTEGEELYTKATVDALLKAERDKFKAKIGAALANQRAEILTKCAEITRQLLTTKRETT